MTLARPILIPIRVSLLYTKCGIRGVRVGASYRACPRLPAKKRIDTERMDRNAQGGVISRKTHIITGRPFAYLPQTSRCLRGWPSLAIAMAGYHPIATIPLPNWDSLDGNSRASRQRWTLVRMGIPV